MFRFILAHCKTWDVMCGRIRVAGLSSTRPHLIGLGGGRNKESSFQPVPVGDRDGITYQRDVGISNLHEITDIFKTDPNIEQAHIFSENNLKAMTLASELAWATARTVHGKLVGCLLSSKQGDYSWRTTGLFVLKEYRKYGIGEKLYHYGNLESLTNFPLGGISYVAREVSRTLWPQEQIGDRGAVAFGVPSKYTDGMFPTSGDGFSIVPFERGLVFDRLVQWDTSRVHWVPRPTFLKAILTPSVGKTYVAVDDRTEEVVGYGLIQQAFNPTSQILGPLYAENDSIAFALLGHLMQHYVPGNNIGGIYFDRNKAIKTALSDMGVPDVTRIEIRHVNVPHPEKYKSQVYTISNCGTQFY